MPLLALNTINKVITGLSAAGNLLTEGLIDVSLYSRAADFGKLGSVGDLIGEEGKEYFKVIQSAVDGSNFSAVAPLSFSGVATSFSDLRGMQLAFSNALVDLSDGLANAEVYVNGAGKDQLIDQTTISSLQSELDSLNGDLNGSVTTTSELLKTVTSSSNPAALNRALQESTNVELSDLSGVLEQANNFPTQDVGEAIRQADFREPSGVALLQFSEVTSVISGLKDLASRVQSEILQLGEGIIPDDIISDLSSQVKDIQSGIPAISKAAATVGAISGVIESTVPSYSGRLVDDIVYDLDEEIQKTLQTLLSKNLIPADEKLQILQSLVSGNITKATNLVIRFQNETATITEPKDISAVLENINLDVPTMVTDGSGERIPATNLSSIGNLNFVNTAEEMEAIFASSSRRIDSILLHGGPGNIDASVLNNYHFTIGRKGRVVRGAPIGQTVSGLGGGNGTVHILIQGDPLAVDQTTNKGTTQQIESYRQIIIAAKRIIPGITSDNVNVVNTALAEAAGSQVQGPASPPIISEGVVPFNPNQVDYCSTGSGNSFTGPAGRAPAYNGPIIPGKAGFGPDNVPYTERYSMDQTKNPERIGYDGTNGKIDPSTLIQVQERSYSGWGTGPMLLKPDVAQNFIAMRDAARSDGIDIILNHGYRSYYYQYLISIDPGEPIFAQPGRSNHGTAVAIDVHPGPGVLNWMNANGARWNLINRLGSRDPIHFSPSGR